MTGEPRQRLAERLARGHGIGVGGSGLGVQLPEDQRLEVRRARRRDRERTDATQLLDRGAFPIGRDRLAVPPLLVGQERDPVALLGARHDQRRPFGCARFRVRGVDRRDVMAVDLDRVPTVCLRASGEQVRVPSMHRGAALAEPVEVEDRDQVVDLVEGRSLHRFPDAALRDLGITHEHPGPAGEAVQPHGQRHPESDREALAQRAAGDVDPRHLGDRSRVALDR